jgi:hypothetical protein
MIIQFFIIISVLHQQPNGHLQKQIDLITTAIIILGPVALCRLVRLSGLFYVLRDDKTDDYRR